MILSAPTSEVMEQLGIENNNSSEFQALQHDLANHPGDHPTLTCNIRILNQEGELIWSRDSSLNLILLGEYHSMPTEGHMGVAKTYSRRSANVT